MILDASYTLLVACIALLIGMFVVKFTPFLQKNHIPEAVVGNDSNLLIVFYVQ
ncbi:TPA: sodium/glutamate symporter, partial [Enterobacter hormaechei subsp. hoffmannii]|nr:sodium/glutamate symporter [Enterobacter hormaechei subsp. hoffmannii]